MKVYSKGINFRWNLTFADFADFTKICEYKSREIFDFHSFSRISSPPQKKKIKNWPIRQIFETFKALFLWFGKSIGVKN